LGLLSNPVKGQRIRMIRLPAHELSRPAWASPTKRPSFSPRHRQGMPRPSRKLGIGIPPERQMIKTLIFEMDNARAPAGHGRQAIKALSLGNLKKGGGIAQHSNGQRGKRQRRDGIRDRVDPALLVAGARLFRSFLEASLMAEPILGVGDRSMGGTRSLSPREAPSSLAPRGGDPGQFSWIREKSVVPG